MHRLLLDRAGSTQHAQCTKPVKDFLRSLDVVFQGSCERLLGDVLGSGGKIDNMSAQLSELAVTKDKAQIAAVSSGVSLASHTGACLEACKVLASVPLSNHAAVTKATLAVLGCVKDAKNEIGEITAEADDEEEDLSAEDMKRVKLASELANLSYSTLRKFYDFSLRCKDCDDRLESLQWLEDQLQTATLLGTALDDLGSTLYAPQDASEVKIAAHALARLLDKLLVRFPDHPDFASIFKLTFSAKEQEDRKEKQEQQDTQKVVVACTAFIEKCRTLGKKTRDQFKD